MRVNGLLSDMFFNYEHPHYDALNLEKVEDEEIRGAIFDDAVDFLNTYGDLLNESADPQDLADDFMARR